ncbi:hypothetical protein KCP78_05730 [Salmonella enterica subsp. enterica]|nr:hypothetical protein KCP78_05730 [Salmonella enterica subsp. enterica]
MAEALVIPACLNDRQNGRFDLRRVYRHLPWLGLFKLRCSDYFITRVSAIAYSGLKEDEIWQLYGWLGQKMANYFPPQVMQQTALQIGAPPF